ncbi:MAG: hypothetical protein GY820_01240 [Gammaproteobacteria bacterium]|nr:hypothetical protein [Gammaproteobacteria bacterium]
MKFVILVPQWSRAEVRYRLHPATPRELSRKIIRLDSVKHNTFLSQVHGGKSGISIGTPLWEGECLKPCTTSFTLLVHLFTCNAIRRFLLISLLS